MRQKGHTMRTHCPNGRTHAHAHQRRNVYRQNVRSAYTQVVAENRRGVELPHAPQRHARTEFPPAPGMFRNTARNQPKRSLRTYGATAGSRRIMSEERLHFTGNSR